MKAPLLALLLGLTSLSHAADSNLEQLFQAIQSRNFSDTEALLNQIEDPNTILRGLTAVRIAIKNDDIRTLQLLQANKAVVSADDLIYAAEFGKTQTVRLLLQQGMSVETADPYEITLLIYAALNGHYEMVKTLLNHGANIEAREVVEGYNALILASAHGYADIVKLLLDQGADKSIEATAVKRRRIRPEQDRDL